MARIIAKVAAALSVVGFVAQLGAPVAWGDLRAVGLRGWQVQSSAVARQSGARISRPGFSTASWLHVRPDAAGAVGTEIGALVQNGRCPGVFFSMRMRTCFGYVNRIGADTVARFSVPWWFRTEFVTRLRPGEHAQLIINGVVGKADVWVNGSEVATAGTVAGDYTRFTFDITRLVGRGANALALKVYPNDPATMFTLDEVDWTQIPPDNDTGIQFPIQLHAAGPLGISDAHVVEDNAPDVSSSALTLKAKITNLDGAARSGEISATVTSPSGAAIRVQRVVTLPARATQAVAFSPADDPQLLIDHPAVWWPSRRCGGLIRSDGRPAAVRLDDVGLAARRDGGLAV